MPHKMKFNCNDPKREIYIETVLRSLHSWTECDFSMSTIYYVIKKKRGFKIFMVLIKSSVKRRIFKWKTTFNVH